MARASDDGALGARNHDDSLPAWREWRTARAWKGAGRLHGPGGPGAALSWRASRGQRAAWSQIDLPRSQRRCGDLPAPPGAGRCWRRAACVPDRDRSRRRLGRAIVDGQRHQGAAERSGDNPARRPAGQRASYRSCGPGRAGSARSRWIGVGSLSVRAGYRLIRSGRFLVLAHECTFAHLSCATCPVLTCPVLTCLALTCRGTCRGSLSPGQRDVAARSSGCWAGLRAPCGNDVKTDRT